MSTAPTHEADVVIVGAGISGLIAARTVLAAGLAPVVLEADDQLTVFGPEEVMPPTGEPAPVKYLDR